MESPTGVCRVKTTAKQSTLVYLVLIGLVSETVYHHYNANFQSSELKHRICELERRQGIAFQKLAQLRLHGFTAKYVYADVAKSVEKNLNRRVRRSIDEKSKLFQRSQNTVRSQILRYLNEVRRLTFLMNNGEMKEERCHNVTLVCKKGERGRRGKAGPRGLKGDMGNKGEKGVAGPTGRRGSDGAAGKKGQKGDPGQPGRSISKPVVLTKLEKTVTRQESSSLTLYCEANGYPKPDIRWEFDKRKINDSRYTFPTKGGLFISNVNRNDAGSIQCIAENILGRDVIETRLIVHTKPKVILTSRQLTAQDGIAVEAVCNAEGNPFPTLKWSKAFGQTSAKQVLSSDRRNLTLKFDKPVLSDAGWYVCKAENYVGRSGGSFLLSIGAAKDCSGYLGSNGKSGVYTINTDGQQPEYFVTWRLTTVDGLLSNVVPTDQLISSGTGSTINWALVI